MKFKRQRGAGCIAVIRSHGFWFMGDAIIEVVVPIPHRRQINFQVRDFFCHSTSSRFHSPPAYGWCTIDRTRRWRDLKRLKSGRTLIYHHIFPFTPLNTITRIHWYPSSTLEYIYGCRRSPTHIESSVLTAAGRIPCSIITPKLVT